MAPHCLRP
ncbi:hypothetical protein Taro_055086 [Colocasia esculenta]|uniref:Uncharacterized protein n=1 Tax=Colocasia esculenta TaxID=4460 RepID=A0A843XQJ5_COLES|nr:hypothetical protein [Colocasia esculenta]